MTFKEFFSFRANRSFWLNLVGMVLLILLVAFGALWWLGYYTRHGEAIVVPNVKGSSLSQAITLMQRNALRATIIDSSYVRGAAPGEVLDQNPDAGSRVKRGRAIYLTINSENAPRIAVPDLMDNSSLRQAEAKLVAMGFKLTEPEWIDGEKDWVYGLKYKGRLLKAGEKIPRESRITITVGNGFGMVAPDTAGLPHPNAVSESGEQTPPVVDKDWF